MVPTAFPGQGYGATETSSLVASNSHEDMMVRSDSVGTAVPCCDVRVVSANGETAASGEPGELWVRGPNVVAGYWNMPEATQEAFVDGWYKTGDIATVDPEGFITILDRIKDMLIRGGENIYCVEIENFLMTHADVAEAAVFGLPERTLGEVVGAAVRLSAGSATDAEALIEHVRTGLGPHKAPVRIALHEAPLPRNAAGKVLKTQLRAELIQSLPEPTAPRG
jgi:long-chain acyl-CoA synthetase